MGAPVPSPTVEMGVKRRSTCEGAHRRAWAHRLQQVLPKTTQALKAALRPRRNRQCVKKSNWPPRHERTARVYPDETEGQQQHLPLWTCCQCSATSEPRDRKRRSAPPLQTLVVTLRQTHVLPWGQTKRMCPPRASRLLVQMSMQSRV